MERPERVDTHSHYLPAFYREELIKAGHAQVDGMPAIPEWSEANHLSLMDELNISRSILSISSPGTHLVSGMDEAARTLTRRVNAYGADIKRRNPQRFGYFASLPLPDIEGSLAELKIAFEEGADGVALLTNFHGVYLGDPAFEVIFEELNKRKAKVFIHPAAGCLCEPPSYPLRGALSNPGSLIHAGRKSQTPIMATPLERYYPAPMMEYFFDTARAVTHLFLQGTVLKSPHIKWLISHVGGALPPMIYRLARFAAILPSIPISPIEMSLENVQQILRTRFFFDTAGFAMKGQIDGLIACAGVGRDRLLYGSDYPFTPRPIVEMLMKEMDVEMADWQSEEIDRTMAANAHELFGKPEDLSQV